MAEKKNWFARIWSAICVLFGMKSEKAESIKNNVEEVHDKLKDVVEAIQNKKYDEALKAAKDAAELVKDVAADVKEAAATVKATYEGYKTQFEAIRTAVENKDKKAAHDAAIDFSKMIIDKAAVPAEQLTGIYKEIFDKIQQIITDIDDGKFDVVISVIDTLLSK